MIYLVHIVLHLALEVSV